MKWIETEKLSICIVTYLLERSKIGNSFAIPPDEEWELRVETKTNQK